MPGEARADSRREALQCLQSLLWVAECCWLTVGRRSREPEVLGLTFLSGFLNVKEEGRCSKRKGGVSRDNMNVVWLGASRKRVAEGLE